MKKYTNLDGLRTFAAIGIILMHVRANIGFKILVREGFINYIVNNLIARFASFVQLFFIISGFAMCCGYYEKIKTQSMDLNRFYTKRYMKIFPFYIFLLICDLGVSFVSHNLRFGNLYEAFAQATLTFGFLPAYEVTVIGVSWTLGIIFGFYILFPFFIYLIWTKRRAWISFAISFLLSLLCESYFATADGKSNGVNMVRWICFFLAGGLIYLYRVEIEKIIKNSIIGILVTALGFCMAYVVPIRNTYGISSLLGFSLMLIGVLCPETKLWSNSITKFISGISLEIYLAHMMVFRIVERLQLNYVFGNNLGSYVAICILTIIGVIVLAVGFQWFKKYVKD